MHSFEEALPILYLSKSFPTRNLPLKFSHQHQFMGMTEFIARGQLPSSPCARGMSIEKNCALEVNICLFGRARSSILP